jgi:ABC-type transport system involved in multi-copper enzyme maturation permease subunit
MRAGRSLDPGATSGVVGRAIKEALEVQRDYRGFVWYQWFRGNLAQIGTLIAVLLGSGGLISASAGGATLFTLALPVSRNRLLGVRAAAGLAEFLVLILLPSLLIPLLSPAIGQHYSVVDAVVHAGCVFVAGAVFFSLAFLLSSLFSDFWRPLLLGCAVAMAVGLGEQLFRSISLYGIYGVMAGERYFRSGQVPWLGLLASAAAAAAMIYGAIANIARQDF